MSMGMKNMAPWCAHVAINSNDRSYDAIRAIYASSGSRWTRAAS
jgi:hypothetical protein